MGREQAKTARNGWIRISLPMLLVFTVVGVAVGFLFALMVKTKKQRQAIAEIDLTPITSMKIAPPRQIARTVKYNWTWGDVSTAPKCPQLLANARELV